jgi:hypothetical protein
MRFRNTLILGLVLVALGSYVYFVEFERAAKESKKETLFDFDQNQVQAVTLKYPDREIALEKVAGEWRLVRPVEALADESTTKNLIRAIAECEIKKRLDDVPKDLKPFGLDVPDVVIHVKLESGELPEIRVGKTTPVGFSTYIQRADDPKVLLASSAFHSGMEKQVRDLRDKQILRFDEADVRKIAVKGPDRDIFLVRAGDDWKIEQPRAYPADASVVRSFLSSLRAVRATDFPDENPVDIQPYGLDIPRLSVTLFVGKDEDRKEILIGKEAKEDKLYVKSSSRPTVYEVSDWVYRDLDKKLSDFRDKTVLAFDKEAVTEVAVIPGDGESFTLQRKDKTWHLSGAEEAVDPAKADQFLSDLHSLKGYEIAAEAPESIEPFGLASPKLTITLRAGENSIGTVKLGAYTSAEGEKSYAAMREGEPTVFRLRDYLFTRLDHKRSHFLVRNTPTPKGVTESKQD